MLLLCDYWLAGDFSLTYLGNRAGIFGFIKIGAVYATSDPEGM